MTYVEIIKRRNKKYYYLTKNIRLGINKWKKIRIYIGDKKPTKIDIKKYAQEVEKKIKSVGIIKSVHPYLSNDAAETLQDLKEGYKAWLKKTPESLKKKLNEDFVIRFTYNTNAIEGNRLTLRQTALILKDKVIPSGVRASDYHEAINGKECLEFLNSYKGGLNNKLLEKVNYILTKNTEVVYGGRIRFFDVEIIGSKHIPPKHEKVKKHLLNMYKWYSANKNKLHPFELATMIHAKLTWIHPFEDGNGRTSRAIMNWLLIKNDYPMFFIPFVKREEYYMTLEEADKDNFKAYMSRMLGLIIDQVRSYGHKKKNE
ncbi:Fic family protein [Candidatus Woesearchaeota archaeon]|jgi:Fic family protein|nr:Fic family protein [Candidatus Woesearchaeota archaeon]MBT7367248.1 Fic family protein [Candidatus Woesearchaeota archaeon]